MKFVAKRYDSGETVIVEVQAGRIVGLSSGATAQATDWVAPGLIDLQVNGFRGQEFNDFQLTAEKVERVSLAMDQDGLTGYCPTATTQSFEMLAHALRTIAGACESSAAVARRVCGIHLEGPYISPEDGPRGAHPRQHVRPPCWTEFQRLQEAAGGRIRILTISPEYSEAPTFIARAAAAGVVVAIGHTSATSDQIRAAVDAGARMSTHLGNGAHGQIRRHPNYIWDQLADDRLIASLIVDGHHLPAAVVKSFVRAKTPARCVLVSDITGLGGMPPGRYRNSSLGDVEVLEDGRLVVAGQRQYLAGAALPMTYGVANIMRYAGVDLRTAIEMASVLPGQLMGRDQYRLAVGSPADLVLFRLPDRDHDPIRITATIIAGERVSGELPGMPE